MLKRITYFILTGLMFAMSVSAFAANRVQAAPLDPGSKACEAVGVASGASGDCTNPAGPSVDNTLKLGINVFSLIVGVAAVIMVIVGGLKYVISQGDSSNVNSAKNTILYAIVGLVVVALAQVVVKFVLGKATQ